MGPCEVVLRSVATTKQTADLLVDVWEGLGCANGKLVARDKIIADNASLYKGAL